MTGLVTLSGDRAAGKTHAVMAVAALDAITGRDVVYETVNLEYASHMMRRMLDIIPNHLLQRADFKPGKQHILTTGGGRIRFRGKGQRALDPYDKVQTYVIDDHVPGDPLPIATGKASHVYVATIGEEPTL